MHFAPVSILIVIFILTRKGKKENPLLLESQKTGKRAVENGTLLAVESRLMENIFLVVINMTKLLMKKFLPKGNPADHPKVRSAAGTLSGIVGIICNLLLFCVKLAIGLISGAVSIIADAMNNLSDASSSLVTLIGFKLAEKPADPTHPYGHARFEYLSGLAIAGIITIIGVDLAKNSIAKIIHPQAVELTVPMMIVLVASIGVKLWLSVFNTKLGNHIQSQTILTTAADSRNDVIATGGVLVAAAVEMITQWKIDGFFGLAVALFIIYNGIMLARDTISPLLGESASPELQRDIISLLEKEPSVLGYHDMMVHDYGPGQRFGSLHVEMDQNLNALWCHERIDDLERECMDKLGVHLVIHYDPIAVGDEETDLLREKISNVLSAIDENMSLHDFRMVKGDGHSNLIFDISLPHPLQGQEKRIEKVLNAALEDQQRKYFLVITFEPARFLPD